MADSNSEIVLIKLEKLFSNQSFPILLLILQIVVFWGIWKWYFTRVVNSTDGFYGIFALISVVLFCFRQKTDNGRNHLILPIVAFFNFLFAITYNFLPPLLQGVMAFTTFSVIISLWRFEKIFHFGIWSLFVLSLPSIASLQFFLGYPLRVFVGETTSFLLKLNGLSVVREGVGLNFGEKTIWIDAPCSGIKMLWAGFFLTSLLITIWRFNLAKSILAFLAAAGIILIGNIFRATGLFYLEAEIIKMPGFAHDGIGVVTFIFTCLGIVYALQKMRSSSENIFRESTFQKPSKLMLILFLFASFSASYVQIIGNKKIIPKVNKTIEFPASFENKPLQELSLTEIEEYFMQDFPGVVKRFTDGEREIIIRYIHEATRKLHSPTECFAGNGYQITPLPLKVEKDGTRWGCFRAQKGEKKMKVCERIYNQSGENWTDVSAWYWSALSDEGSNGYWAIAVAERLEE